MENNYINWYLLLIGILLGISYADSFYSAYTATLASAMIFVAGLMLVISAVYKPVLQFARGMMK